MPAPNNLHLRLYGHTLCPFVERVRLVLANTPYQDCQINLEFRTKWHYFLNNGFVPILETPKDNPLFGRCYVILESKDIMNFLNEHLKLNLYSADAFLKAEQVHLMNLVDKVPILFLHLGLSKGTSDKTVTEMIAIFEKLEVKLR